MPESHSAFGITEFGNMRHEAKLQKSKPGPKIDLISKAEKLRESLPSGYTLLEYGRKRSTFKHSCGNTFSMGNRSLLNQSGKCPCLHKKVIEHDVASLQAWHRDRKTGYTVVAINGKLATLHCKHGHTFEIRKFYNRRCPECFTNIFATNTRSHKEYLQWLKENRQGFKVLGTYENVRTPLLYKHLACGQEFQCKPYSVARASFRCPACAPRTCSSYRRFVKSGVSLHVRGKESIALDWILKNTTITIDNIEVDSEGTVPKIPYRGATKVQTYRPDFYVRDRNLLIEVKDCRTLGLGATFFYVSGSQLWETNCAKAQACIERGYKFQLLLFDRNNLRVKLPKLWYEMTHSEILNYVKRIGVV